MARDLPLVNPSTTTDDEIDRSLEALLRDLEAVLSGLERQAEFPDDEIDAHVEALAA